MSYQLTFESDGTVKVYIWKGQDGYISVATTPDKLAGVLPGAELDALRARCVQFLDVVGAAPLKLKAVQQ